MEQQKENLTVDISFPFDRGYCIYHRGTEISRNMTLIPGYLKALEKEISGAAEELEEYHLTSVRLGHGLLLLTKIDQLADFLLFLRKTLPCDKDCIWSAEVLPDQLSAAALTVLRNADIRVLHTLVGSRRSNEFEQLHMPEYFAAFDGAVSLLTMCRQRGLHARLILGIPGQTPDTLADTLVTLRKAGVEMVSASPFSPELAGTDAYRALEDRLAQEMAAAGFVTRDTAPGFYVLPGSDCERALPEEPLFGCMGFGAGAVTRLDGMCYRNTANIFLYMDRSCSPEQIAEQVSADPAALPVSPV